MKTKNILTSYAAFLRGVGPENANTRNAKLREVFEGLGFEDVHPVISSGNVIFRSDSRGVVRLENKIERALAASLGFEKPVIVRSKADIENLVRKDPFKGKSHDKRSYLIVTFMKKEPWEEFSVIDLTKAKVPNTMSKLEKKYGKAITTRTWKTVIRIADRLEQM